MASGPYLDDIAELVDAGKVCVLPGCHLLSQCPPSKPGEWELSRGRLGQCLRTLHAKLKDNDLGSVSIGVIDIDCCI